MGSYEPTYTKAITSVGLHLEASLQPFDSHVTLSSLSTTTWNTWCDTATHYCRTTCNRKSVTLAFLTIDFNLPHELERRQPNPLIYVLLSCIIRWSGWVSFFDVTILAIVPTPSQHERLPAWNCRMVFFFHSCCCFHEWQLQERHWKQQAEWYLLCICLRDNNASSSIICYQKILQNFFFFFVVHKKSKMCFLNFVSDIAVVHWKRMEPVETHLQAWAANMEKPELKSRSSSSIFQFHNDECQPLLHGQYLRRYKQGEYVLVSTKWIYTSVFMPKLLLPWSYVPKLLCNRSTFM